MQILDQHLIDLDGDDAFSKGQKVIGQGAAAGADLDQQVAGTGTGFARDALEYGLANQEMLAEAATQALAFNFDMAATKLQPDGAGGGDTAVGAGIRRQRGRLEARKQQAVLDAAMDGVDVSSRLDDGVIHDASLLIDAQVDNGIGRSKADRSDAFEHGPREQHARHIRGRNRPGMRERGRQRGEKQHGRGNPAGQWNRERP